MADVRALQARVEACEMKIEAHEMKIAAQDATIGKAIATFHQMREERKEALSPAPRPLAAGRRLSSASNPVNEISITGPTAVVSWNSHTPGE